MALTNEDKNWIKDVVIDAIAPLVKDLNEFKNEQRLYNEKNDKR